MIDETEVNAAAVQAAKELRAGAGGAQPAWSGGRKKLVRRISHLGVFGRAPIDIGQVRALETRR